MAILKIINNTYNDAEVFDRLVNYITYPKVYDEYGNPTNTSLLSPYYGGNNLFFSTPDLLVQSVSEQMKMVQTFYGKDSGQYVRHFILSFDSTNSESSIDLRQAIFIANLICHQYFTQHQILYNIHTNRPSHLHIHFVVNTVNFVTGMKLSYNRENHKNLAKFIRLNSSISSCTVVYETMTPYQLNNN